MTYCDNHSWVRLAPWGITVVLWVCWVPSSCFLRCQVASKSPPLDHSECFSLNKKPHLPWSLCIKLCIKPIIPVLTIYNIQMPTHLQYYIYILRWLRHTQLLEHHVQEAWRWKPLGPYPPNCIINWTDNMHAQSRAISNDARRQAST